jgi:hypothetical protein
VLLEKIIVARGGCDGEEKIESGDTIYLVATVLYLIY